MSRHRSPSSRGHGHRYGGYVGYPYYSHPYWGYSVGLGWWGGYYYNPYYRYGFYHSPYWAYYGRPHYAERVYAEPVGAFDLNVRPKRTEVWVDGSYVGNTGRFDGFPDYLWLDEGEHQLVFYLDGYVTVERTVETLPGVVADLRIDMQPGEATPASEMARRPAPMPAPGPKVTGRPALPQGDEGAKLADPASPPLDVRGEPSRLVLVIEPADASVYLDGRYLGTGRDLARLHAGLLIDSGDHRLEIVRPGFADRAVDFTVGEGEEERIEIGLESG